MTNPLNGVQEVTEDLFLHYTTCVQNPNPKNPYDKIAQVIVKHKVKLEDSYESIEQLFADEKLLSPNTEKYSVKVLQKHIMLDCMRGLGTEYPEYGIVAYSGASLFDKPIVSMVFDEGKATEYVRYFPTPDFSKLVKRI